MINFNHESGFPSTPRSIPMLSYPEMNPIQMMQSPDLLYNPTFTSYPDRRPMHFRGRCRSRPIIHIIESDSCSSISSYSPRRHRSYSHPRQRRVIQQQKQQPIIFLPVKCQQSPTTISSLQRQSQQNILSTIQVQQQQQQPRYVLSSVLNTNSTADIINNNRSTFQPSTSTSFEQLQQSQTGPIQYVQTAPELQFISVEPRSSTAPQHVFVNNTNKKQSNVMESIQRSTTSNLP
ncbi:unnamed protein product [Rotaria sp. Silwood2]|nr:unnamed protein product [Rotaria sp. Silwood2]CAF4575770.1 unnamed protein product [Rotaria sp. Silwood2]